ncbi:MAG TPA: hypothetical protein VMB75_06605 [Rhodocyclaceae bacterium]|nr:hypothetical protein [Rhodocyclaceae bacterium]
MAQPRAEASFGKLLRSRVQAVPTQLLAVGGAAQSAAGARKSPFEAVLEWLLGLTGAPSTAPALEGTGPAGSASLGFQVAELSQHSESESCSFAASGKVCLADGSSRQFDVGYQLERSEESSTLSTAAMCDPLVLDLAPPTAGLGAQSVDFDLDGDGKTESVRLPPAGSALLFDDRNHNGRADDGSELFGPQSGDGFAELGRLDSDGNGWIDSGDAAFADLKLWQLSDQGAPSVRSLADTGIGALAIGSAATPFTLKENGAGIGQMRASSVWLGETTGAGTVREIDLAVAKPETSSA